MYKRMKNISMMLLEQNLVLSLYFSEFHLKVCLHVRGMAYILLVFNVEVVFDCMMSFYADEEC